MVSLFIVLGQSVVGSVKGHQLLFFEYRGTLTTNGPNIFPFNFSKKQLKSKAEMLFSQ